MDGTRKSNAMMFVKRKGAIRSDPIHQRRSQSGVFFDTAWAWVSDSQNAIGCAKRILFLMDRGVVWS
eukprot:scaffold72669_cov47-Attheya_sp.AAC.1